jgi:hypothetical protein
MKQLITIFLFLLLFGCNSSRTRHDCIAYQDYFKNGKAYHYFNSLIDKEINENNRIEIFGNKRNDILKFVKNINDLIIGDNALGLIKYISKDDFRRYDEYNDGASISDNISSQFIEQLQKKSGPMYYFLFNRMNNYSNSELPQSNSADSLDIKKYLLCFQDTLIWKVLYYKKENRYEVWFSMPDGIIHSFGYFHYVLKEYNGKYILIGF